MKRYWLELVFVVLIAGAAVYSLFVDAPAIPILDSAVGAKVMVEGVVVRDPDVREGFQQLTVDVGEAGYVLVRTDNFGHYEYGDRVRASGKIEFPEEFETDTGRTFNYPKYLLAHGVTHTLSFAEVEVLRHGEGNPILAGLIRFKHICISGIERALPEPESALLAGLLLGEKRGLGEELSETFRRAGVIHIIVLSGYNISLVIDAVRRATSAIFPRTVGITSAGVIAILFMLMTGASETAIRATLMALVVLVAQALHRPALGLRILLLVAAGMAVWNPMLVLFDLSYQLSVLATLGLILFTEPLVPYFWWLRSKPIMEIAATSVATQVAVLPLLIISIGQISVVSIVTNVLVLLTVPYAMLLGGIAAGIALLSPTLALPFSTVAYAILTYIVHVSALMGSLQFAVINL